MGERYAGYAVCMLGLMDTECRRRRDGVSTLMLFFILDGEGFLRHDVQILFYAESMHPCIKERKEDTNVYRKKWLLCDSPQCAKEVEEICDTLSVLRCALRI